MVTSLCSCTAVFAGVYAQQFIWMNAVMLSVCHLRQVPKVYCHLKCLRGIFWPDVISYMNKLYFCIFVTRLHLLSSNNKSIVERAPLHKGWNTWDTWEKLEAEPFIFTESHVSNWVSPAVVLNLCPSDEIEKWPDRPYLTLSLHLPFPLRMIPWCSDKEAF